MAEDIYQQIKKKHPAVSFATVYRNLNILVETGEIQRIEFSREKDRFDGQRPSHAHFVCTSCGKLLDIDTNNQSLIASVTEQYGHKITDLSITFTGICASCQKES